MKKLLLITTGGTIASLPSHQGLAPSLDPSELERFLLQEKLQCEIVNESLFSIDSTNMQPEHWVKIAELVSQQYDEYDGFLITHGTDTMAFTAAALSYFLCHLHKPVVLTGSQVPFNNQKTDAKRNLLDAAHLAMEDIGGVFVVFNGKVIAGTRAMKLRTKSFDAFESVNFPYIGFINDKKIDYQVLPEKNNDEPFCLDISLCTDVFLIKLYPGIHPDLFAHFSTYRGVVIESFGNGGIPSLGRDLVPTIEALVENGVAVVVTTQCLQEGEDLSLYEVGRRVAQNPKIIISKDMNTEAIIPKLMWALGKTNNLLEVTAIMETPVAYDCSF